MSSAALNGWRWIYLAVTAASIPPLKPTLTLGAGLWLVHDLAHARWRALTGDIVALTGLAAGLRWLAIAGVSLALSTPDAGEPFIWSLRPRAARGAS